MTEFVSDLRQVGSFQDTDYDKRSALHLAAVMGNVDAVDFLLKNHFCFPDARDR
jgi:ankyrin repeat protein